MDALPEVLLGFLGVFAGFLGGLLGIGGGVIATPFMILVFFLDSRVAVGTSLAMILFTAISSTFAYYRQRRIDWKVGIVGAMVTVPGALLGAYATQFFSSRSLAVILGATLFLMSALMLRLSYSNPEKPNSETAPLGTNRAPSRKGIWRRLLVDSSGKVFEYDAHVGFGLVLLFAGGLISGFLGVGGGLIVVPILSAFVGLPMHIAVATSMLVMIFTSISAVSTHIMLGNVRVEYVTPLVVGVLGGTQLGARTAKQLRSVTLERVFAFAILAIGIILIITRL